MLRKVLLATSLLFAAIPRSSRKSRLPSPALRADGIFAKRTLTPPGLIRILSAAAIRLYRNYKEVRHERQVSQYGERGRIGSVSPGEAENCEMPIQVLGR